MPSNLPPTRPPLARNSSMTWALNSAEGIGGIVLLGGCGLRKQSTPRLAQSRVFRKEHTGVGDELARWGREPAQGTAIQLWSAERPMMRASRPVRMAHVGVNGAANEQCGHD